MYSRRPQDPQMLAGNATVENILTTKRFDEYLFHS